MIKDFPVLVGLSKTDAFRILAQSKIIFRIHDEDGKIYNMSDDFVPDRVNLSIENNIITDYNFF